MHVMLLCPRGDSPVSSPIIDGTWNQNAASCMPGNKAQKETQTTSRRCIQTTASQRKRPLYEEGKKLVKTDMRLHKKVARINITANDLFSLPQISPAVFSLKKSGRWTVKDLARYLQSRRRDYLCDKTGDRKNQGLDGSLSKSSQTGSKT